MDYIKALPGDVVASLPTMPGFSGDWAGEVIADAKARVNQPNIEAELRDRIEALEQLLCEEKNWHRHTKDKLANALIRNSQMAGEFDFHFNQENRPKLQGNQL